ncbi:MAG: MlaD family protein [Verrucomicrobiota bacterium]
MKKPEYIIVLTVIACSVALAIFFGIAIGKIDFDSDEQKLRVYFKQVEGLKINGAVKYAGAPVGRVTEIKVIPRSQREELRGGFRDTSIVVTTVLPKDLYLPNDLTISMKQDGMLGPKYIAIMPGDNLNAPELDHSKPILGGDPVGLEELYASGQKLLNRLVPTAGRLQDITVKVDDALPGIVVGLDTLLDDGDQLISSINSSLLTPDNEQRIKKIMSELDVVLANMKVVSSNAKALTMTLAQTPWRLVWGGPTNPPVPEQEVLNSDQPVPIDNVIEVNRPRSPGSPASN